VTLPPYAVDFRGHPACPCQVAWLPAFEHELQRRGLLTGALPIYQLIGGATASAGTHSSGGAADFYPDSDYVWVARQMGADATWLRPYNWDGAGGMAHIHSVLTGCPHNGPARYQIDAVRAGQNGLASHGADTGPRPLSGRTWQQGIEWARAQEDEVTPEDIAKIADAVTEQVVDKVVARLLNADLFPKREDIEVTVRKALQDSLDKSNRSASRRAAR
jgi:hypothetical protein